MPRIYVSLYTDDQLIEAIKTSKKMGDITKKLGLKTDCFQSVQKRVNKIDLDGSLNLLIKKIRSTKLVHSDDARTKISEGRKKFLKENPEQHNWSSAGRYRGQETYPEKMFKETLVRLGIPATQFYNPPENDRNFELDFCVPELKIAWEINGNQHYESDYKTLKPYYQNRHDYFVKKGWKIIEINSNECHVEGSYETIITKSMDGENFVYEESPEIANFKFQKAVRDLDRREAYLAKQDNLLNECNRKFRFDILSRSANSRFYFYKANRPLLVSIRYKGKENLASRKAVRPDKISLKKLIWQKPITFIAKDFGVSDSAVSKWCRAYGIKKPGRGYWTKYPGKMVL